MFKLIKFVLGIAIILVCIFALLTGYGMLKNQDDGLPVCNLNDYIVVTQSGKNGEGVLYMTLDTEKIIEDYREHMDNNSVSNLPDWLQRVTEPLTAENAVRTLFNGVALDERMSTKAYGFVLSKSTGLSNGDEVIVQWTETPANIVALKLILPVNFEYTPFSYTVQNLFEPEVPAN